MITVKTIENEILKDENMEVEYSNIYENCLEVYHNSVYTDLILTNAENLTDEIDTVIFNNGNHELQLLLPNMNEIISNLYQRIDY